MGFKVIDNLVEKLKLKIPLSFGEARAAVKMRHDTNAETREAHKEKKFPIHYTSESVPDQMGQQKFLEYALSFIKLEYPLLHNILMCRMKGLSNKQLSKHLQANGYNVTEAEVSKREAEAIRVVKQTIERVRSTGIPIFENGETKSGLILRGAI
jgi:hypothetical protein